MVVRSSLKGLARVVAAPNGGSARINDRSATHDPQPPDAPRGFDGSGSGSEASHPSVKMRMDFGEDHVVGAEGLEPPTCWL